MYLRGVLRSTYNDASLSTHTATLHSYMVLDYILLYIVIVINGWIPLPGATMVDPYSLDSLHLFLSPET